MSNSQIRAFCVDVRKAPWIYDHRDPVQNDVLTGGVSCPDDVVRVGRVIHRNLPPRLYVSSPVLYFIFVSHLLLEITVMASKGRAPASSSHPWRPSFNDTRETLHYVLEESPQTHQTAEKGELLNRDHQNIQ